MCVCVCVDGGRKQTMRYTGSEIYRQEEDGMWEEVQVEIEMVAEANEVSGGTRGGQGEST